MRKLILGLVLVSSLGCGDTIINNQLPATTTPTVVPARIQYRVSGNATSARIRYSNESDGLIQTISSLPYFTTFSSTQDNLFLSLEVTPIAYPVGTTTPFLNAQIFVNGNLFREASSNDLTLGTVTVNGTWRK